MARIVGKQTLVFGNYLGEIQFYKDVLEEYIEKYPSNIIIIAHESRECYLDFIKLYSGNRFYHIHINVLTANFFSNKEINLYLSSEALGIENIFSIYLFHGQPSKALSFHWDKLLNYDAFFLYGKMHKESLAFFSDFYYGKIPEHLYLYEIGYPKTDNLINGTLPSSPSLEMLGIDKNKKTILYAPAFNEYASLREYGIEILKTLAENNKYNVVAKLPIDCLRPSDNLYANGGINWFEEIEKLCNKYNNIFLSKGTSIDPLLLQADVMVTCISSVAFEFLALKKPVIYIDTPKFFDIALKETYFPNKDINGWDKITFINGGKEFGPTVKNIHELPQTLEDVLNNYHHYPYSKDKLSDYILYNHGKASTIAVNEINNLLATPKKSHRKKIRPFNIIKYVFSKAQQLIRKRPVLNNNIKEAHTDSTPTKL